VSARTLLAPLCVIVLAGVGGAQIAWSSIQSAPGGGFVASYDSWRDRVVMVTLYDETWEFDGVSWQLVPNANTPDAFAWCVFNEATGATLGLGGPIQGPAELMEWRGVTWQSRGAIPVNIARDGIPFDHRGSGRLMFALHTPLGLELHEYNGVTVSLIPAPVMPPTATLTEDLSYWNFTYDEVRDKLVVFGVWVVGLFSAGPLPQTWEWDPVNGWVDLGTSGTLSGIPWT